MLNNVQHTGRISAWCMYFVLMFCLVMLLSGVAEAAGGFSPHAARDFLAANPSAYVVDVRMPEEHVTGTIRDAHFITLYELSDRIHDLPNDRPIVFYCAIGRRAKRAYEQTTQMRPELKQVYYIDGKPLFNE